MGPSRSVLAPSAAHCQGVGKKEAQPHNGIEASQSMICTGSDPCPMFEEQWINHLPQTTKLASFAEGNRVLLRWTMSHGESTPHHCMVPCVHFSWAAAGRSLNPGTKKPLNTISTNLQFSGELHSALHSATLCILSIMILAKCDLQPSPATSSSNPWSDRGVVHD